MKDLQSYEYVGEKTGARLMCHVHVGMPKTGTSSIQATFSTVDLPGLRYLPLQNSNHSFLFPTMFERKPWTHRSNRLDGRTREEVEARKADLEERLSRILGRAARAPGVSGIVFSGERLATPGRADSGAVRNFRDFFGRWCGAFRIYGYVRPLASFLPSDFQQRLQMGVETTLDPDRLYPRYRDRFEKFDRVFGRENVSLAEFRRTSMVEGNVVLDLAQRMGVCVAMGRVVHTNESLGRDAAALLFAMVRAGKVAERDRDTTLRNRAVVAQLRLIGGERLSFDPEIAARLAEREAKDIAWVEERIGAPVSDPLPVTESFVRCDGDLLELASAALPRLREARPIDDPNAVQIPTLVSWVEEGLTA